MRISMDTQPAVPKNLSHLSAGLTNNPRVIKDDIMPIAEKVSDLKKVLEGYGSVAVAFSGGVDSSFLAKVSRDLLGENAVALTIDTPFVPRSETAETTRIAGQIGIRHSILVLPDIDASILSNSRERCYLCKRRLFTELLNTAGDMGLQHLIDFVTPEHHGQLLGPFAERDHCHRPRLGDRNPVQEP